MKHHISVLSYPKRFNTVFTVSSDGRNIIEYSTEDLTGQDLVYKGIVGELDGKRYWLFRDEHETLWLCGSNIDPIKITEDITSKLEGGKLHGSLFSRRNNPRCLTILQGDTVLLSVTYHPDYDPIPEYFDFTAASMDDSRGDFGLSIHQVLTDPESRRDAWGRNW